MLLLLVVGVGGRRCGLLRWAVAAAAFLAQLLGRLLDGRLWLLRLLTFLAARAQSTGSAEGGRAGGAAVGVDALLGLLFGGHFGLSGCMCMYDVRGCNVILGK